MSLPSQQSSTSTSLATFALRKPVTTVILFLSLLMLGAISSRLLPLEKFPGIEIPELFINIPYPNSTPAEVERQITKPVGEVLATISGIQEAQSWSNESGAILVYHSNGMRILVQSLLKLEKR